MENAAFVEAIADEDLFLPRAASPLTRMRFAFKAIRILEKEPEHPEAAALFMASLDGDVFRRHARRLAKTEQGRALLAERPTLQKGSVDLDALLQLPEQTVGRAFAQYFIDNGIEPFATTYPIHDDGDYLARWYRETHDLHHLVSGYKTDPMGEMELQAFVLGNLGLRMGAFVLFVSVFIRPEQTPRGRDYFRRVWLAYRRGKQTRSLLSVRYEQLFEQTVEALRDTLHVPPLRRAT